MYATSVNSTRTHAYERTARAKSKFPRATNKENANFRNSYARGSFSLLNRPYL